MTVPSDSLYARGFAADAVTLRALRAGLTGRKVKLQRGRLAAALRRLAAEPASKLVFVDLDGVTEPETAARELAGVCAFETALIGIGSTNTAQFIRTLFQYGMTDYLVKPISAAVVREASAAVTGDLPDRGYAGRVIAFSGSAGSGKSTLVAALARLAAADGRTATVVDLDPVSGRLPDLLDAAPADGLPALLDALDADESAEPEPLAVPDRIDGVRVPVDAGLSLVAYRDPAAPSPAAAEVIELLGLLANRTHLVLVTGLADPDLRLAVMQWADARVLLYEPTLSSISAAVRCLALLGTDHPTTLAQCFSRASSSALTPAHVRYAIADRRPDVVIPFDPALHAAATGAGSGRPGRAYRKAMWEMMERLIDSWALAPGSEA